MSDLPDQADPVAARWRTVRRVGGYVVGVGLLIGCIVIAAGSADWSGMAAEPRLGVTLACYVGLNVVTSGLIFWLLTRPFELGQRVGIGEMQMLIAASTLLNYLPLRPGLFGRAYYLKRLRGIPLRASVLILLIATAVSAVVYAIILVSALVTDVHPWTTWFALTGCMLPVTLAIGLVHRLTDPSLTHTFGFIAAAHLRLAELILVVVRLGLAFEIAGIESDLGQLFVLATAGMFISLTGLTPNGLGLREWVYGLIIGAGLFTDGPQAALEQGLAAGLIDRAAEAIVIIPLGLLSLPALRRNLAATVH